MIRKQKMIRRTERKCRLNPGFSLLLLLLCVITSAVCIFLYQYDNKYTASGPGGSYGQLELDAEALDEQGIVWLVDGWEFYGGRLLNPADFQSDIRKPDRYVFAGQFGGFEIVNEQPYGSASYRLTIKLPDEMRTYSLYLPEILSSCRLYINGTERLRLGQTSPANYTAGTAETIVPFEAAGQAEILIAVSNYSNTYGGLTYPPAFGIPGSILDMAERRLNLRTALLTMTLMTGAVSFLIGMANRKNPLPVLYSLFCLLFFGFTSYPVVKTFFPSFGGLYLMENLSFCGMILMVFILQRRIFSFKDSINTFGIAFGGLVCLVCLVYHLLLPRASLEMMLSYSKLINLYKWLSAFLLTVNTARILKKGSHTAFYARILLCGMAIFDCTLVMDRMLPLYEPVYSGWFLELSSLRLVLLIGAVILQEIYRSFTANLVLEETVRLTRQNLAMQKEQHKTMMDAIAGERAFRHDLRHHISVLHEFADADDTEALKRYFSDLESGLPVKFAGTFCENAAADAVIRHYEAEAKLAGVDFISSVQIGEDMTVSDVDLCVIFGNCLENALEACKRQESGETYIKVSAGVSVGVFAVTIENSFNGVLKTTPGGFLSSKRPQEGIGTASVQAIAKKYEGRVSFETDDGVFRASILLHL